MKRSTIRKAKPQRRGKEIVIAHCPEPGARVAALQTPKGERKPGSLKGMIHIGPEFFEPLPPEESDSSE